jgi:RNA polymerase sigma-70 factor (ECF subfamily)
MLLIKSAVDMSTDDKYHLADSPDVGQPGFEDHLSFPSMRTNAELLPFGVSKSRVLKSVSVAEDRSTFEQPTDEALMTMLRDGRQDAIGCLFRRHARAVHTVGRRILRDSAEAEDLVQEVFLYVFRKCGLYDSSKGSARSWLIQIAYTQAFLRRRKLKSLGLYEAASEMNHNSHPLEIAYDHSVEALFGRHCWKAILDDLSTDQEQVLRLHFFEGYTFTEIAEKLGQSYANIRNHHYRGLEKLRKHLAEDQLNKR